MSDNDSFHSAFDSDSSTYSDCDSDHLSLKHLIIQKISSHKYAFNVCHINAQSIPQHFDDLYDNFATSELHAILVSESWLKPTYPSTLCSLPGYILLRNDRTGKGGGGVAIYLQSNFTYKIIATSPSQYSESIEYIFAEVIVGGVKVILGSVYCPPNINDFPVLESLLLSLCSEYAHQIIMGDFNTDLTNDSRNSRDLRAIFDSASLFVLPLNPTHHNIRTRDTWIDLMIVSSPDRIVSHGQLSAPCFSRHDLIFLSYKIKPLKQKTTIRYLRNFSKLRHDELLHDAALIDWSDVYGMSTIDLKVETLNKNILGLFDKHAPIHKVIIKRPPAPWITPDVRLAMNKRDRAFSRFKKNRSDDNWGLFKQARNRCNQIVRVAKRRYIQSNVENSSREQIWKFLSTLSIPNRTSESKCNISLNILNKHFASVPVFDNKIKFDSISHVKSLGVPYNEQFILTPVTNDDVSKLVLSIRSKAVGSDLIGRDMIIFIIDSVLPVITHIINFSLVNSVFPSSWRNAFVTPLAKCSNPNIPSHYRPISILPYLSKVLEAVVHKQLTKFIEKTSYLSPFQSGFRVGHSTTTALIKVTEDVRMAMEESRLTILVLIDFSNAFNLVNHDILMAVLSHVGLTPSALEWFSSYLRGRRQITRNAGCLSDWCDVVAGVPQGGILSPLLFSVYINLITHCLKCFYHLYADDLQIYTHAEPENINAAVDRINYDLSLIKEWSLKFGISVNPMKCQAIIIGSSHRISALNFGTINPICFDSIIIPFSYKVKNLGLIIDDKLSWLPQVTEVCRKVTLTLRSLYRLKNFLPMNTKRILVQALLLPIIDYGDVCYIDLNRNLVNRLDRIINNCVRFIFGLRKFDSVISYRSKIKILSIDQRRQIRVLCTLFSILFDPTVPSYLKSLFQFQYASHPRNLRSTDTLTLHVPLCHTNFLSQSFTSQAVRYWNTLPTDIRNADSKFCFKCRVKKLLSS